MKQKLLLFLLLFVACIGSKAQEGSKKEVTPEERSREIVDHLAKKISMTKGQKDSVNTVFLQFMDDIQKYNAQGNQKLIDLLSKSRDDKVKKILHDDQKFDQYLAVMADLNKQREENPGQQRHQHQQGGQHNHMGGGMQGGMPGGGTF